MTNIPKGKFDIDIPKRPKKPSRKGKVHFKFIHWKPTYTKKGKYMSDVMMTGKTPKIFKETSKRKKKRKKKH